ncbi:hypothetical protein [Paraburkholderia sp. RL17-381-BIF-C]|uniref:hypothetical protein n=1 Tax=Paraburkholderia sp. RL17-381-BIF-C TaxID=3031635 RepID=UPI0038BB2B9F
MIDKALPAGLAGEKLSRTITGTDEVSARRSAIAAGSGAGLGYLTASGMAIGLEAVGLATAATVAAPAIVPVALVAGGIALIRSLFD